ncbi:hypothetical protein [Sphingomonas sp. S2M10]|uniref:hypothetical protein n=1 Tax=Sphingomonas sp. S2M10 TaxID=2705010 RepID=UPI001457117F|nr:hypothetical protein [Sphingomonas sp. S2M10]
MGNPLSDQSEVLFRHIHPNFMQNGEPASDRFKPQPNDAGMMSVDRSALTTAGASHALYVSRGLQSAAVFGISVGEFGDEEIPCKEDPISASDSEPANPAHALADYTKYDDRAQKNISKRLKRKAIARGQLHP